jgi:hypothetical protein
MDRKSGDELKKRGKNLSPQNVGDSLTTTRRESLFPVTKDVTFLKHPLTNVRCAVHHLNALCAALIQQANSFDVHNVDFIQVQSCRVSEPFDYGAQIDEVRTTKVTGQADASPVILTKPFNSQRHSWHLHLYR